MRFALSFLILLSTACATSNGPRPVNVSAVRHAIDDTIQAQAGDRTVTSMGKVTADRAVVFTTLSTGARQEETWTRTDGAWTLEKALPLDGPSAAR